jgi:deoxycytidylate deaminase
VEVQTKEKKPDIVFGLVGAAGADFNRVSECLDTQLKMIGYETELITLSQLIVDHIIKLAKKGITVKDVDLRKIEKRIEPDRTDQLMNAGNELCRLYHNSETIASLAIQAVKKSREGKEEGRNLAYILKSLKRPEEVYTLRRVYGSGFYLIGVYSSREKREESLKDKIARTQPDIQDSFSKEATGLIERDEREDKSKPFGQEVSHTFHLADVFISIDRENKDDIEKEIKRFIEMIFSNPFYTPTKDEYAMFFAQAAALRSGALARQVGAAIASADGEILSVGTNDVPRQGGGLCWPDAKNDHREVVSDGDSNTKHINHIAEGIAGTLVKKEMIKSDVQKENLIDTIKGDTYLKNLTEFGRTVHAEMDSITQASRLGISIKDAILYTTLFPCQNCAKHIVASGIQKVVYVEPYGKSLAKKLHNDSICVEEKVEDKIPFLPFEGIGPRRFLDLFSLVTSIGTQIKRKEDSGEKKRWYPADARPRLPLSPISYLEEEKEQTFGLNTFEFKKDDLNFLLLRKSLQSGRKIDVLILQKLDLITDQLDQVSDDELLNAFNKFLESKDFHTQAEVGNYKLSLKSEALKLFEESLKLENTLNDLDFRTLYRALLEAIYPQRSS